MVQSGRYNLNLMGVEPTYPSEKYGYVIPETKDHTSRVTAFKEKPDLETARRYLEEGALWNCGVFAFRLGYVLERAHELIDFSNYTDLHDSYDECRKISFDYAVGGCIRDSLLMREPNDWDITTSAMPQEIKKTFRHTVDTGIKHGTVTVLIYPDRKGDGKDERPHAYEVTTYRIDGEYEDSRHPSEVTFTKSLAEDLKRRDFTINAMAYNDRFGLVDPCGGTADLEKHLIRCVGEPEERFTEDALRILRAVRFSAQLGFDIEERTSAAVSKMCVNLKNISAERIREELVKLITSQPVSYTI